MRRHKKTDCPKRKNKNGNCSVAGEDSEEIAFVTSTVDGARSQDVGSEIVFVVDSGATNHLV